MSQSQRQQRIEGKQQEGVEGPELAERHQAALGDGRVVVEGEEKLMEEVESRA